MAAYDFIVVGAGSAGCAVAGRLAAESSATVLLIEAGGSDRRLAVRAPLAGLRQFGTSLDWGYETDPEPDCADRRIPLHTGRVLGGTSAMNAMVWVKGSNLDYDGWQLPGWSWDDVAPVFARIEQGPMRISRTPYPDELSERFVAAARAAGVRADDDVSGPELDGVTLAPVTIHNGPTLEHAAGLSRTAQEYDGPHQGRGSPGDHPQRSCRRHRIPPRWTCPAGFRRPTGRRERRRLRHTCCSCRASVRRTICEASGSPRLSTVPLSAKA